MKLILIAGKARSGKTSAARFLKEILEEKKEKVVITEYSKYIKLFAKDLLGWDMVSEPKPRAFLQDMGHFVRQLKTDVYFVERMKEDLQIYKHFVDAVIISDVRMPREIDGLEEFKPLKIQVINDLASYDLTDKEAEHETEHALDHYTDFDYVLKNKTEEEMYELLKQIVKENEL